MTVRRLVSPLVVLICAFCVIVGIAPAAFAAPDVEVAA